MKIRLVIKRQGNGTLGSNYKIHIEGQYTISVKSLVSEARISREKLGSVYLSCVILHNVFNLCPNSSIYKTKMIILPTLQNDYENSIN